MADVTVYTTQWCGSCKRLKAQLASAGISFDEVDVEKDDDAATFVMATNDGALLVPTVKFADGSALGNPPVAAVKAHVN